MKLTQVLAWDPLRLWNCIVKNNFLFRIFIVKIKSFIRNSIGNELFIKEKLE
jgi:hypothetical protein